MRRGPLFGSVFELVCHRRTWGVDRVYFHDGEGTLSRPVGRPISSPTAKSPVPTTRRSCGPQRSEAPAGGARWRTRSRPKRPLRAMDLADDLVADLNANVASRIRRRPSYLLLPGPVSSPCVGGTSQPDPVGLAAGFARSRTVQTIHRPDPADLSTTPQAKRCCGWPDRVHVAVTDTTASCPSSRATVGAVRGWSRSSRRQAMRSAVAVWRSTSRVQPRRQQVRVRWCDVGGAGVRRRGW